MSELLEHLSIGDSPEFSLVLLVFCVNPDLHPPLQTPLMLFRGFRGFGVGEERGLEGRKRVQREREGKGGTQDFAPDVDNLGECGKIFLDRIELNA